MLLNTRAGEVPELIRKNAEEFAGVFYDQGRTQRFRKAGLSQKAYVRRYWHNFVEPAVQVLSQMLSSPGLPEGQKREIYDAIIQWHERQTMRPTPPLSLRSLN
jgi:hypothetical protein